MTPLLSPTNSAVALYPISIVLLLHPNTAIPPISSLYLDRRSLRGEGSTLFLQRHESNDRKKDGEVPTNKPKFFAGIPSVALTTKKPVLLWRKCLENPTTTIAQKIATDVYDHITSIDSEATSLTTTNAYGQQRVNIKATAALPFTFKLSTILRVL